MEIGNAIFGNSRGEHEIDRAYQDWFYEFMQEKGFSSYGYPEDPDSPLERDETNAYHIDGYIIRPYYWGEDDELACLPNFVCKATGYRS